MGAQGLFGTPSAWILALDVLQYSAAPNKTTPILKKAIKRIAFHAWELRGPQPLAKKSPELGLPTGAKDLKRSGRPLAKLVSGFCTFENPKKRFADKREEYAPLKSKAD